MCNRKELLLSKGFCRIIYFIAAATVLCRTYKHLRRRFCFACRLAGFYKDICLPLLLSDCRYIRCLTRICALFQFDCCGVQSYKDWYSINAWPDEAIVPDSCCLPWVKNTTGKRRVPRATCSCVARE